MLVEAIESERIRAANERMDYMAKINVYLVFTYQSRHRELMLASVPYLDFISIDTDLNSTTDKAAWNGISILFYGYDRIACDHAFILGIGGKQLKWKVRESCLFD